MIKERNVIINEGIFPFCKSENICNCKVKKGKVRENQNDEKMKASGYLNTTIIESDKENKNSEYDKIEPKKENDTTNENMCQELPGKIVNENME